jgi:hypothetical protein
MTTTHDRLTRPAQLTATTTAIFAVLGFIDVGLLGVIGSGGAPPLVVNIVLAALGLVTLGLLPPARRGSRAAVMAIVVARVISALLAIPPFFLGAPVWVRVVEGLLIIGTVAALVLLRRARTGAAR